MKSLGMQPPYLAVSHTDTCIQAHIHRHIPCTGIQDNGCYDAHDSPAKV